MRRLCMCCGEYEDSSRASICLYVYKVVGQSRAGQGRVGRVGLIMIMKREALYISVRA